MNPPPPHYTILYSEKFGALCKTREQGDEGNRCSRSFYSGTKDITAHVRSSVGMMFELVKLRVLSFVSLYGV